MHTRHPGTHPRTGRHMAAVLAIGLTTGLCSLPGLGVAQTGTPAPAEAAASAAAPCVQVEVHHLRAGQGHLMLAAYGSADSFGKQALSTRRVAVVDTQMRIEWCGLAGETVAFMGYQDLDNDGKMGRNLVGMPTEPWGSSGNPGAFGPTWDTGRVPLNGQPIVVRMSQ